MDKLQLLKDVMDQLSKDSSKFFDKGNKAAGTRARKNLQELKKLAQELRVAIQDTKANMTVEVAAAPQDDADVGVDMHHPDDGLAEE